LIEKKLVEARRFLNQAKEMMKDILIEMNRKHQAKNKEKELFSRKEISLIERIAFINIFDRS
jgi:polyribonucleotide nucleotidyltransferase